MSVTPHPLRLFTPPEKKEKEAEIARHLLDRDIAEEWKLPGARQLSLDILPGNRVLRSLAPLARGILGEKTSTHLMTALQGVLEKRRKRLLEEQAHKEEKIRKRRHERMEQERARLKEQREQLLQRRRKEEEERKRQEEARTKAEAARKEREEKRKKKKEERVKARAERWQNIAEGIRKAQERYHAWQKERAAKRERGAAERERLAEEKKRELEAKKQAQEEEHKRHEEEKRHREEEAKRARIEERARKEAERAARTKARVERWAGFWKRSAPTLHSPILDEAHLRAETDSDVQARIAQEAKKEAMKQVLIEQEKQKLLQGERDDAKMHAGELEERERKIAERERKVEEEHATLEAERKTLADTAAKTPAGGSLTIDPAALEALKKELAAALAEKTHLRNQVATRTREVSGATKVEAIVEVEKKIAAERVAFEREKEQIRADARAEAERQLTAEREAWKATAAPVGGNAANEALVSELRKQLAAAQAQFALEREKLQTEALSMAEEKVRAEFSGGKGRGKTSAAPSALTEELAKWKQQVEKLETERREIEERRALQEEQERTRREQKRLEEERLELERQRIARERAALEEEKIHKIRIAESTEQLREEEKQLKEEKKKATALPPLTGTKRQETPAAPKITVETKVETRGKEKETNGEPTIDIGHILVSQNYIDAAELKDARTKSKERNVALELILKDEGLVTKELLQNAIAEYYKMPFIDLRSQPPDPATLELLPQSFCTAFNTIATHKTEDGTVIIATSNPERQNLAAEIQKALPAGTVISLVYTSKESIDSALGFYQKPLETRFQSIIEQHKKVAPEIIEEIFSDAIQLAASDIHFEPQEKIIIVRFRVDGVMHEAGRIPKEYYEGIVNRIKIAGNMRIDEHFSAQDGAIRWKGDKGRAMDVRVSIVPIVDGEKIVLRLLSEYVRTLTLSDLGFTPEQREFLIEASNKPFGMVLTTGPTGSGKSTTLYGLMKICNTPDVNISTIEDPVEYKIPGINHIQVNLKTELTFERGLRALVRQDPDIILVGEIRDNITAQISVNAALTGHLLFSTLHANDAATAVPRLLEMGVEPYLLASTLELIIAQRLMRRICLHCRHSSTLPRNQACSLFYGAERYFDPEEKQVTLYQGKGCPACGGTGFRGRIGLYEILIVTTAIEEMIVERRTTAEINNLARREGMLTLFEDGLKKVKAGMSTIDELLRVAAPPEPLSGVATLPARTKH